METPAEPEFALATTNPGLDIVGHILRHPCQSLLIAAGVGYVLGGGLFTRLTFNVLRVAVRVGALPVVQRELLSMAESALSNPPSPS